MIQSDINIRSGGLGDPAVQSLLQEHWNHMRQASASCHALDRSQLYAPDITFWSAWQGTRIAGCGALKELDPSHGEIKSMRTAPAFQRQGIAAQILETIMETARTRGYQRLSLETGSMEDFLPARAFYRKYGFHPCPPFGDYVLDPESIFMTQLLL